MTGSFGEIMFRKSGLCLLSAFVISFVFLSCLTGPGFPETAGQQEEDIDIAVKISGAADILEEGETALLTAEIEYSGSEEIEYMWFEDGRQTGENSGSLSLNAAAYSQIPVRLIVKAGNLVAEDSVIVRWSGNGKMIPKSDNLPGSVIITSVDPDRFLVAGAATEFTVRLSYSFPANITADLKVIFNNGADSSDLRVHERYRLKGGTGEYEFKVTAVPVNWEEDDFYIFVLLSAEGCKTGLSARKVLEFR